MHLINPPSASYSRLIGLVEQLIAGGTNCNSGIKDRLHTSKVATNDEKTKRTNDSFLLKWPTPVHTVTCNLAKSLTNIYIYTHVERVRER